MKNWNSIYLVRIFEFLQIAAYRMQGSPKTYRKVITFAEIRV